MTQKSGEDDCSHRAIRDLLGDRLQLPGQPVDGDCLVWTPKVVDVLRSVGIPAEEVTVVGWCDVFSTRALAFMHRVALLDGTVVVDVTARQFAETLTPIWVVGIDEYCAQFAAATGVGEVTVGNFG